MRVKTHKKDTSEGKQGGRMLGHWKVLKKEAEKMKVKFRLRSKIQIITTNTYVSLHFIEE